MLSGRGFTVFFQSPPCFTYATPLGASTRITSAIGTSFKSSDTRRFTEPSMYGSLLPASRSADTGPYRPALRMAARALVTSCPRPCTRYPLFTRNAVVSSPSPQPRCTMKPPFMPVALMMSAAESANADAERKRAKESPSMDRRVCIRLVCLTFGARQACGEPSASFSWGRAARRRGADVPCCSACAQEDIFW